MTERGRRRRAREGNLGPPFRVVEGGWLTAVRRIGSTSRRIVLSGAVKRCVSVLTSLDVRMLGNAFVRYNSTYHTLDANMRLRYAFAAGTDLWLVNDEGSTRSSCAIRWGCARRSPPLAVGDREVLPHLRVLAA
jgi:hypothetical protein